MIRYFLRPLAQLAFALLAVAVLVVAAYADADSTVTLPVGDWTTAVVPIAAAILLLALSAVLLMLSQFLPAWARPFVNAATIKLVDQLLEKAIEWGVANTVNAAKGKTLDIDVGSKVVAEALNQALTAGPGWLISWAGGPDGIAKKIIARLNAAGVPLDASVTADAVLAKAKELAGPTKAAPGA